MQKKVQSFVLFFHKISKKVQVKRAVVPFYREMLEKVQMCVPFSGEIVKLVQWQSW